MFDYGMEVDDPEEKKRYLKEQPTMGTYRQCTNTLCCWTEPPKQGDAADGLRPPLIAKALGNERII